MVNTSDILPNTPRYLKVPLIFFNAILWILGVVLIAIGGYALNQLQSIKALVDVSIPAGLIVLGVFIVVLTVVGCAVAYKEKLVGLIFYTVVMLLLLVCLIGVGGGAFTYREKVPQVLEDAWLNPTLPPKVRPYFEDTFTCCGWLADDHSPYNIAPSGNKTNCVVVGQNCTDAATNVTSWQPTLYCDKCTTTDNSTTTTTTTLECHDGEANATTPFSPDCTDRTQYYTQQTRINSTANGTCVDNTKYNPNMLRSCDDPITAYVQDRLYVAAMAGVVVGVIEFVCMLFSLFLIVRLCRSPRARSYD